jgi:hypothetical protein
MAEKAENIKRIMSSYLRMAGGRIKWVMGVLHLRNENDTAYQNLSAGDAELDSVTLKDVTRTNSLTIKPDPNTGTYDITLPQTAPNTGDVLRVVNPAGDTEWSDQLTALGNPFFEEIAMSYGQVTYSLQFAPSLSNPIQALVNGIEVEFTILANTITITTYSSGEIENTDILRVYYYK